MSECNKRSARAFVQMILSDLGFDKDFLDPLREKYLTPISRMLFPEWTGSGLDSHRAFTVTYEPGKDEGLGFHFDNAEVRSRVVMNASVE